MSKAREFAQIFALYYRAGHRPIYCARIAYGCVFRHLPF